MNTAWPRVLDPATWRTPPCIQLPTHWQRVDFISDIHLSPELPHIFQTWQHYMLTSPADAIWLLGDVFELWVGDDVVTGDRTNPSAEFARACADVLKQAAQLRPGGVALMVGNRDFLVGDAWLHSLGVTPLADPTQVHGWGQRVLLSHGDALCVDDAPYMAFRQQVRQSAWQQAFLSQSLDARLAWAQQARQHSQAQQDDASAWVDVSVPTQAAVLKASACDTLVHGHTHRGGDELPLNGPARRVISDWRENEQGTTQAQALVWTAQGWRREALVAKNT